MLPRQPYLVNDNIQEHVTESRTMQAALDASLNLWVTMCCCSILYEGCVGVGARGGDWCCLDLLLDLQHSPTVLTTHTL